MYVRAHTFTFMKIDGNDLLQSLGETPVQTERCVLTHPFVGSDRLEKGFQKVHKNPGSLVYWDLRHVSKLSNSIEV